VIAGTLDAGFTYCPACQNHAAGSVIYSHQRREPVATVSLLHAYTETETKHSTHHSGLSRVLISKNLYFAFASASAISAYEPTLRRFLADPVCGSLTRCPNGLDCSRWICPSALTLRHAREKYLRSVESDLFHHRW
jgi:hypothetical protein